MDLIHHCWLAALRLGLRRLRPREIVIVCQLFILRSLPQKDYVKLVDYTQLGILMKSRTET